MVTSVKSTLGQTVCQPRSMPPWTVAEIASIACPCWLCSGAGCGQVNEPPLNCSIPSMVLRLSTTRPVEVKPSISWTDPLTVASLRLIE